jgi:glycosyltransferase involved in cell wall biosynthesis
LRNADKIIILMPNAYSVFESMGINKEKVIWIPNGINLNYLKNIVPNPTSTDDKYFKIMFAGSLNNANSIETLLAAAKIVQNSYSNRILFEVYGKGNEEAKLLLLKKSLDLYNFKFRGSVLKRDIYKVLSNADVLWAGQKKKNIYKYGISFNKLFDYLAAGKPIIFSSNAFNNPVAEAGAGLTVPPEDPEAVAEAIIKLYNISKEERNQMGENGRKYVERNYSISVLVDKLETVITEVCNSKNV